MKRTSGPRASLRHPWPTHARPSFQPPAIIFPPLENPETPSSTTSPISPTHAEHDSPHPAEERQKRETRLATHSPSSDRATCDVIRATPISFSPNMLITIKNRDKLITRAPTN